MDILQKLNMKLKILIVCSGNFSNSFEISKAFVYDQVNELRNQNIEVDIFLIKGNGIIGYLKNLKALKTLIKKNKYSLLHAHGGLSSCLSNMQFLIHVVTTFHGSDINKLNQLIFSQFAFLFSSWNIFVSKKLKKKIFSKTNNTSIIPCGVDLSVFKPIPKTNFINSSQSIKIRKVLFASSFNNKIKNPSLAKLACSLADNVDLIELKNKTRFEVNSLLNSVDLLLMTSFSEGSPQIIKEAMACNCPIVSLDVGDVREIIGTTERCFISSSDPKELSKYINLSLKDGRRTNGRSKISHLSNKVIVEEIIKVYNLVLDNIKYVENPY